jgi:hypothetical protein
MDRLGDLEAMRKKLRPAGDARSSADSDSDEADFVPQHSKVCTPPTACACATWSVPLQLICTGQYSGGIIAHWSPTTHWIRRGELRGGSRRG